MEISVIIPTYKPQSYLWDCLASISAQTFPKDKFELILVLNGCSEPWKGAIEQYICHYMSDVCVNFIHIEQGGVSNARNLALDNAKGKYVAFIDDDDMISPSYLERLYECVASDTIVLCYPYAFRDGCLAQQLKEPLNDVYDHLHTKECTLSSKARKFFSGPCMKLIPIQVIRNCRFDSRFKNGEDTLFMFLISDNINKLKFTSSDAIYYRRYREGSAVMVKRSFSEILGTNLLQIKLYFKYYFHNPFRYNLFFFITRVGGSVFAILKGGLACTK